MESYKNPALTPEERARDLLSRMTLQEKIGQINITRGVAPRFSWWLISFYR